METDNLKTQHFNQPVKIKTVQFQLQFQNLRLIDLKNDENEDQDKTESLESLHVPIAIAFDRGTIPHPHPELASNLDNIVLMRGAFLLCLPLGRFPRFQPFNDSNWDEVVKRITLQYFVPGDEICSEQLALYSSRYF